MKEQRPPSKPIYSAEKLRQIVESEKHPMKTRLLAAALMDQQSRQEVAEPAKPEPKAAAKPAAKPAPKAAPKAVAKNETAGEAAPKRPARPTKKDE